MGHYTILKEKLKKYFYYIIIIMEHQDWKPIVLNTKANQIKQSAFNKQLSQKKPDENVKLNVPVNLGKLIAQARSGKSRKQLSQELGISENVLSRWETSKDIPSNSDIAKIEQVLRVKLPRVKKVKSTD
jgi:ribosome-binding protein aMBF1 (putative translation factor)